MKPAEFMQQIKTETQNTISRRAETMVSQASKISSKVQCKVLGIEMDDWGRVSSISDELVQDLIEDIQPEIAKLKTKLKRSILKKAANYNGLTSSQLFTYSMEKELADYAQTQRNKAIPLIKRIIEEQVRKELIEPWQLIAKMRDIDISDIML